MTLQGLADRIGTTPQTVQRLETANMTVSTDWLEKIAMALEIQIVDLLEDSRRRGINMLGIVGRGDRVALGEQDDTFTLDVPADDPVAVELTNAAGPYKAGAILIGNRQSGHNVANAAGRNAIVGLKDGSVVLRRLILHPGAGGMSLLSLESGGDVTHGSDIEWVAPVIMAINYEK